MLSDGTRVTFQYRTHPMLGGNLVTGAGVVQGWTMVGTDRAYVIKPDAGETVHVRCQGVRAESVPARIKGSPTPASDLVDAIAQGLITELDAIEALRERGHRTPNVYQQAAAEKAHVLALDA